MTDAWPLIAAKCRGVQSTYRDRGADDEGRGARGENKEEEGVREHRREGSSLVTQRRQAAAFTKNSMSAIPAR